MGLLLIPSACKRAPSQGAGPDARESMRQLLALREARRYQDLRDYIVPQYAPEVVATLMAVDDFLDANRALCTWLRQNAGAGAAQMIDQAYVSEAVGPFAPEVDLLDLTQDGDNAEVSYTIARRVPPGRAQWIREHGRWRYDPGPGYTDKLPKAFHELAQGLRKVKADLEAGRLPVREVIDHPERLVDRVRVALRPGTQMLSAARAASGEAAP